MSDETFSSRPPILPMPTTIRFWSSPASLRGAPYCACCQWLRCSSATCTATSASTVQVSTTSGRSAMPFRSRAIRRNITCLRNLLSALLSDSSSDILQPARNARMEASLKGWCKSCTKGVSRASSACRVRRKNGLSSQARVILSLSGNWLSSAIIPA